jgi:hypothetical protein
MDTAATAIDSFAAATAAAAAATASLGSHHNSSLHQSQTRKEAIHYAKESCSQR